MSIVKLKRAENPFEILPRATLQDARLSLDALGALVRLASLPGDWEWQTWHLEKEVLRIGRDWRRRIFNELESAGYLTRSRQHNNKSGRWQHEYNLVLECSTSAASAGDGLAVAGKTVAGQGDDIQNIDLENTKLENTQQQPEPSNEGSEPAAQSSGSLLFPSFLNKDVVQKIQELAAAQDQVFAQQILDVLAARADVKNPIAFFKKLASDPPSFDPTLGLQVAAARIKKKEVEAAKIAASELKPDAAASAKGEAILAAAATRRAAK